MSPNHRYFLFINLLSNKLIMYELCEMKVLSDSSTYWDLKKAFELKTERSHMF
jgi:hypothetical protein